MVMSSKESNLNEFVTSERLAELGRIISDANRILAAAVLVQGVALVLYYFLFPEDFSFWIVVPEALFALSGLSALVVSPSKNPSETPTAHWFDDYQSGLSRECGRTDRITLVIEQLLCVPRLSAWTSVVLGKLSHQKDRSSRR
jgi:hypothetical protein